MKLPIRDLPQYSVHLPASDVKVSYRPHTVKEEQILNMATMSDNEEDKLRAVLQICENCVDYDLSKLFPAEIEYLFMQIKATSDTPKVPVVYSIEPELDEDGNNIHKDCGDTIKSFFDINTDLKVNVDSEMEKYATRGKDGTWIIELYDDIKIQVRIKPLTIIDDGAIFELTESIIDDKEDAVMFKDADFDKESFIKWVGSLPSTAFKNFNSFMEHNPRCVANIKFKCKCGKVVNEEVEGVVHFLV